MSIRQSIVEERIEGIKSSMGIDESEAFERFCYSICTGESEKSMKKTDIVDGGQDKQIDVIYIDENEEESIIYIIQSKYTDSFGSNTLIQMKNGLDWIFSKPKKEVLTLKNNNFKDKILEVRSVRSDKGPSNIRVKAFYITNAETGEKISEECVQEKKSIEASYDNGTFKSFDLKLLGANEIVEILNFVERKDKSINQDIKFKYDVNNPSLIRYYDEGISAFVCSVSASEIARIVNEDKEGVIFDLNVRRFLGTRGTVNQEIEKSCTDPEISSEFWFLNNGITIVCDKFDPVTDPDNPKIKVSAMQIVNGCQTATTLANMQKKGTLQADVKVLLRIYQTNNDSFVEAIVRATNNQNQITDRDLRSNDKKQLDLQTALKSFNLYLERKKKQYDKDSSVPKDRVVENEYVGKSFLGIRLKRPSDARSRKYKIWSDLYDKVFSEGTPVDYAYCVLLYKVVDSWLATSSYINSSDDLERAIAKNCSYHVARMTSSYWNKKESWPSSADLNKKISDLEAKKSISSYADLAFLKLKDIISNNPTFSTDPVKAFKSNQLDTEITKELNKVKY